MLVFTVFAFVFFVSRIFATIHIAQLYNGAFQQLNTLQHRPGCEQVKADIKDEYFDDGFHKAEQK